MATPYAQEFRDDVVAVARRGPAPQPQVASEFGIFEGSSTNRMKQADVRDRSRPGLTGANRAKLREPKKRIRLLEQENEVRRRGAAHLFEANLPGK